MIGFRNILVHEYGKLDRSKVYSLLKSNLDDLAKLSKFFAKYL